MPSLDYNQFVQTTSLYALKNKKLLPPHPPRLSTRPLFLPCHSPLTSTTYTNLSFSCRHHSHPFILAAPAPRPPKKQQQQQQHSQVGTNGYLAPELIKGERYNSAADIYSFGVLLNTIASLKFPYANMVGGGSEGAVCTWQQINHLSANHDLRPELPPGGLAQSEKLRKLIAE